MEDKKGLIDKIKEMVFATEEVVETVESVVEEVSFAEVKTEDGVTLETEGEMAEGSEVMIVLEEGKEVSGEADYVLEDGRTIKVDAKGKISEIMEAAEEVEEVVEEVVEAELAEDDKEEVTEEVKEDEVDPLEARVAELEKAIEALMSQFSEVSTKVQEFSGLPADEELKIKKEEFSASKSTKKSGLEALANFRKK